MTNDSNRNVLINSLENQNKNDLPHFGKAFLSSAYLFVDYDQDQFTLWKSIATTDTRLVPVGPPSCRSSAAVSTQGTSDLAAPAPLSPSSSSSDKGVPTGGIAGGVVGGVAALALGFAAFYLLGRRKRKQRQALEEAQEAAKMKDADGSYYKAEMPTDRQPPQELPLIADPRYGVGPYELPPNHDPSELPSRSDTRGGEARQDRSMSESLSKTNMGVGMQPQEM
ncbi:MAG: hypothetical protein Q9164_005580 [Protoblastenia rupestris]